MGIALATSISVWVNAGQYFVRLHHRGDFTLDSVFRYRAPRILAAGISMGLALYGVKALLFRFAPNWTEGQSLFSFVALGLLVGTGIAAFFGVLILSGGIPLSQIKNIIRRRQLL